MANEVLVRDVIRATRRRAMVESAAAGLVAAVFAAKLLQSEPGSLRFYGCLVVIATACFIAGVVWRFALSDRLLREHPADDVAFWRRVLQNQSRLLRLVPLWYLSPLLVGLMLIAVPATPRNFGPFLIRLVSVAAVFAAIAWLNFWAARDLERKSSMLGS